MSKRRLYIVELEKLDNNNNVKSSIMPFTKIEKFKTNKYKAPRMIQARHLSFNIEYGKFIKPLETYITHDHHYKHHFGKGNTQDIAERIRKHTMKYKYYTEGDHKTFDAHITVEMLELTHTYYKACYYKNRELTKLCNRTKINKCYSRQNDKYIVKGTRMSGDIDTSFGNSLINLAILRELIFRLNIKGESIVNGDDFIMFTDQPVDIIKAKEILLTMNMETDMKPSQTNINRVEFCRSKLIYNADGIDTMIKDPIRLSERFGMTHVNMNDYNQYLLELCIANWKMHKLTPIGLWFRELTKRILIIKHGYIRGCEIHKDYVSHTPKFKYLERNLIVSVAMMEQFMDTTTEEITLPMLIAYDDINTAKEVLFGLIWKRIEFIVTNTKLSTKHLKLGQYKTIKATTTILHINHERKTLTVTNE